MREDRPRSVAGRLVGTGDAAPAGLFAGVLALGAFTLSLVLHWQTVSIGLRDEPGGSITQLTMRAQAGSAEMLGLVYLLLGVALLGLVGTAVVRPALAAALRGPALGLGAGMLALAVALTQRLAAHAVARELIGPEYLPEQFRDQVTTVAGPGLFLGFAAAVLPVIAVYLAARVTVRTRVEPPQVVEEPTPQAMVWSSPSIVASELTVSPAEPVQGEVWRGH